MHKITFPRTAILFILTGVLCTESLPAVGQTAHRPEMTRFKIEIAGGFDYSIASLTSNHSVITNKEGVVESDLTSDKDGLRQLNRLNTYKLEQQSVDLRLSYRVWKGLSAWVGVGVTNNAARNHYTGTDEVQSKSVSENPELLLKAGLSYTHALSSGFFVGIRPLIAYSHTANTLLTLYYEGESSVYSNYGMERKVLRWEIPVVAGRQMGRFTPYVGVAYKDFRQTDHLDSEIQFVDKMYDTSITDIYHSRSKIHGLAGTTFSLAPNIGIGLSATFSRSIASELTFHLSL